MFYQIIQLSFFIRLRSLLFLTIYPEVRPVIEIGFNATKFYWLKYRLTGAFNQLSDVTKLVQKNLIQVLCDINSTLASQLVILTLVTTGYKSVIYFQLVCKNIINSSIYTYLY